MEQFDSFFSPNAVKYKCPNCKTITRVESNYKFMVCGGCGHAWNTTILTY